MKNKLEKETNAKEVAIAKWQMHQRLSEMVK